MKIAEYESELNEYATHQVFSATKTLESNNYKAVNFE